MSSTSAALPARIFEQYDAFAFVREASFGFGPQILAEANLLFADRGWVAQPELTMDMPQSPVAPLTTARISGIHWLSPDGRWRLMLRPGQVFLTFSQGNHPPDTCPTLEQFAADAASLLPKVMTTYALTATRLVFRSTECIPEQTLADGRQLVERLFPRIPSAARTALPEFIWQQLLRSDRTLGSVVEPVNETFLLQQVELPLRYQPDGQLFYGLRLKLELNTSGTDLTPRFDAQGATDFFSAMATCSESLRDDVLKVLS